MNDFLTEMHRFIFNRSLSLFDFFYMTTISSLASEISAWFWLLLIPCFIVSYNEYLKVGDKNE